MTPTAIPNYNEIRLSFVDLNTAFREMIGGDDVINIGETIRIMLHEFFYSEPCTTVFQSYTLIDRTIVWPMSGQTLFGVELSNAIDLLGELFWSMADLISNTALLLTPEYNHRPHECFYKFFPDTLGLVVYVPVLTNFTYTTHLVQLDGRAVMATCSDTLPLKLSSPLLT